MVRINETSVLIMLSATAVALVPEGVCAGLTGNWMRMSIFLFGSVLMAFYAGTYLLGTRLRRYFARLDDRLPGTCSYASRRGNQAAQHALGILMFVAVVSCFSIATLAFVRQEPFWLAICLFVCAMVVVTCTEGIAALRIDDRLKCFDQAGE